MSLAARLWSANADLAQACLQHPFVQGLGDGALPRAAFQGYVAQDAVFLEAFARAYALCAARSTSRADLEAFADLLAGVREELRLHDGYARQWDVDPGLTVAAPATSAYTDFLLATASLGDLGTTCAAMTPCMRLYAFLGQSLPEQGPYAEWVRTYADPGFEQLARTLEDLLDRLADDTPSVAAAYRRAMELELAFFAAALQG